MGLAQSACRYVFGKPRSYQQRKRKRHSCKLQLGYSDEYDSDVDPKLYTSKRYVTVVYKQFACTSNKVVVYICDTGCV
jgi:hypothetical protein